MCGLSVGVCILIFAFLLSSCILSACRVLAAACLRPCCPFCDLALSERASRRPCARTSGLGADGRACAVGVLGVTFNVQRSRRLVGGKYQVHLRLRLPACVGHSSPRSSFDSAYDYEDDYYIRVRDLQRSLSQSRRWSESRSRPWSLALSQSRA